MDRKVFVTELKRQTEIAENIVMKYLPDPEDKFQKSVIEAMNYSVTGGGKRLRPLLMQETYRMFRGQDEIIEPFMAAIEMIHTYSLVHDDLPLEEPFENYKKGMNLIKKCSDQIDKVEKEVLKLNSDLSLEKI